MRLTLAHPVFLALTLALVGCSSSHDGGDGGVEPPDGCPPTVGSCMTSCCESSAPLRYEGCTPVCAAGSTFIDRCAPAPGCGLEDGGICVMPGIPSPPCVGGACCTESFGFAVWDCATSGWSCPAGSSPAEECAPDPGARCPAPYLACGEPTDCVLASDQCCGPCERTLENTDAVNRDRLQEYFDYDTECAGIDCAPCPEPVPDPLAPRLFATCGADGTGDLCRAFDVRTDPVSACETDADCVVRAPECCECGGSTDPESLIAIRADAGGRFMQLVCPAEGACAGCLPIYPPEASAYCAADGHCAVAVTTTFP